MTTGRLRRDCLKWVTQDVRTAAVNKMSNKMKRTVLLLILTMLLAAVVREGRTVADESDGRRPNVILILTDDQGYGEVAAHGNAIIKTPNMDELYATGVRLTDFHVDPTCSPTRAALLTGRYSTRTGVWHTINGRSMIHPDELTLAETFKANGYRTAMIGKWHLGDNYPCRPEDQGFEHTVRHQGGGVGNGPDYWENDYFDDTFKLNGKWRNGSTATAPTSGSARRRLMSRENEGSSRSSCTWRPTRRTGRTMWTTSTPSHTRPPGMPKTNGQVLRHDFANIDENLGRFRARLDELGLTENTLLIFMTDNGTTAGWIDRKSGYQYYNAGMRGWKGSQWDGGHRVPCFLPLAGRRFERRGRDVDTLSAHVDLLPTLVDLLGLEKPKGRPVDGVSLRSALMGQQKPMHLSALSLRTCSGRSCRRSGKTFRRDDRAAGDSIDGEGALRHRRPTPARKQDVADGSSRGGPASARRLRAHGGSRSSRRSKQTVRYGLGGAERPDHAGVATIG